MKYTLIMTKLLSVISTTLILTALVLLAHLYFDWELMNGGRSFPTYLQDEWVWWQNSLE